MNISALKHIRHRMLLLDESRAQMLYINQAEPEKSWNINIDGGAAWGLQRIGENRVLAAIPDKGGFREYDLATRQGVREFFEPARYAGTMGAVRLPDGRTVLGCDRNGVRLFLLDAENHELAAWEFPDFNGIRQIRRTLRNTLLFGSNTNRIYEISLEGNILRELQLPGAKFIYQASELPNGNILASAGYGGFLAAIDQENRVVRRFGGDPVPAGLLYFFMSQFQMLKNGHLVAATWTGHGPRDSEKGQQVVEFDGVGKVVWIWHDPDLAGSIHSVIVLDDPDTPLFV
jgi:hypothetical protein